MSVLKKLTEGIVERSLQREGAALLEKWENTGLLEGLTNDSKKQGMARLLENQAAQLLKEASSMAAGDVEGFASVAFPIVRRVFGGLLANDLVSVQPMSLPSGLIFFMDFTYTDGRLGIDQGDSLYGGGVVASQLTGGVSDITEEGGGFYNMANAYSHATGTVILTESDITAVANLETNATGATGHIADELVDAGAYTTAGGTTISGLNEAQKAQLRFDADVLAKSTGTVSHVVLRMSDTFMSRLNKDQLQALDLREADGTSPMGAVDATVVRRLTHLGYTDSTGTAIVAGSKDNHISVYFVSDADGAHHEVSGAATTFLDYAVADQFGAGDAIGSVVANTPWPLEEPSPGTGNEGDGTDKNTIAEIDIKVDSIAVTAMTKKLKAKWSPELGQDLNAYHNLDAEVELTQILSEQIALEIDREILNDLVKGAAAGTFYWSRSPGLFVNRTTGAELGALSAAPDFTGTVSEWYETLVETINDVSAQIHRKTLRGGANFLVTSPEVANVLEFTAGFRANVTHDSEKGTVGAVNVGSLSRKFDVHVDPYFPRNLVLVGRKGGSFLESGYVYAPYVPLQVTPTIFGTEDFVPRKGVMTRYAKKMVRPDMYGLVVVRGLLGEAGATS
tara:strand:+ start:2622 stop:4484 length:1863 start_codon:yes stop_codon:yes gene_type:complete